MSTPPDPEQPHRGPVLEPVRVLRPRRLDTLAELMREFHEGTEADARAKAPKSRGPADFEAFDPASGSGTEDETQELPPVTDGPRTAPGGRGRGYGHGTKSAPAIVWEGRTSMPLALLAL
ncbi:hypothetical protein ABT404_54890, partial [Streptomyces hyaluromycini]